MFATLRTTLFKMRAAAARPRTSVCKGRRGTPGAQAPCVIAIYAESSWMRDAPRRMRRPLRRRRPQQAGGRPHGLRSRCAWRARGRRRSIRRVTEPGPACEPARDARLQERDARRPRQLLRGRGVGGALVCVAHRARGQRPSERRPRPPHGEGGGRDRQRVPWALRGECDAAAGRSSLRPSVPVSPGRAWRPVASVLPCGAPSGASARGLCLMRGGLPGRMRVWESDGSRRRRQRAISRSRCSGSVHTSETESPPATRRRMGGGGRRYPTSACTITGPVSATGDCMLTQSHADADTAR